RCLPPCEVTCSQPCAYSRSLKPCVMSCGDSTAMVFAPPVFVRFPGPVFYNCPQDSLVGAEIPQISGPMTSYSSDGTGGSFGSGGMSGTEGSYGSGRYLG
ncbi:KRFJ protein, partial [Ceuthmochares aereus]|nr:KRFJ protein [Ceuthmochares aereus]